MKTRSFNALRDVVAVDYETTGFQFDPGARVFSFSLTWAGSDGYTEIWRKGGAVYIFDGDGRLVDKGACPVGAFVNRLEEFWESPCAGVAHNLKFELHFTKIEGLEINPDKVLHDTMIQHQYLDNLCHSHALNYLSLRYNGRCKEWIEADQAVAHAAKIYGSYDKIPEELMTPYQVADGQRGMLLHEVFWPHVKPQDEYFNEIELIRTTVDMERHGFMIHKDEAKKLLNWMQHILLLNTSDTSHILGRYVNLLSEKQVKALLFSELGLPRQEKIDKDAIEELRRVSNHPILDCILKARSYTKGTAMITGYLKAADRDGCVHPNIWTNKASTGRESSDNPNLQNVSKEVKAGARFTVPARRCFRPRPGKVLLMADYSGIEMRLAVQGTGSEKLFQLCIDGYDFHAACATAFYGVKYTDEQNAGIKKSLRSRAKNARFAMLYGAGLEQTAHTLGLTIDETTVGYNRDKEEFPEFYELMDRCTQQAKKHGFITTFFGRKLRVPHDRPYAATDFLIQGSAAALFKHAQNEVHKLFQEVSGANIVIPVHDELVMEIDRGIDLTELAPLIKAKMIEHPQIVVKLDVDFSVSTITWDKRYDRHY